MALTTTEEAQLRQLITQQAALLSLAGNEATITSKLGAAKVNLGNLPTASALADADLLLVRQGGIDKGIAGNVAKSSISPISSTAEAQAWTANDKFLTPLRLAEAFKGANQSLNQNGFQRLPGGLFIQMGSAVTDASGKAAVTWPIAFPNAAARAVGTHTGGSGAVVIVDNVSGGLTNTVGNFGITTNLSGGLSGALAFHWLAVGY